MKNDELKLKYLVHGASNREGNGLKHVGI